MRRDDLDDVLALREGRLLLGNGVNSRERYHISLEDLKATSVHVVGSSGVGKSFLLRNIINQLIEHRQPFGLIDPHQELYQYALWRLRRSSVRLERIVLLDPTDERYALGFNPLACGLTPGETASMCIEAFLKVWGARSFDETPRLEGILRSMFRLLSDNGLTLLEGYDVLAADNSAFRKALMEKVSDPYVRADWQEFEKLPKGDKLTVVESSRNRLRRVIQAAPLQMMLAQAKNTLNLKEVLDDGKYLLANLGGISPPETQRLIGALLVNGIFHAAKLRDSRRPRHWWLLCDEFGEFATRDFANSLDQLRKFGVHMVLVHQRLAQLQREDPDVLSAVVTNCKIKVVFGGLERPEAERMSRELFTGQVRGDRVKHIATQTKFRPRQSTFTVIGESWSDTDSESESWGESSGTSSGFSDTDSESRVDDGSWNISVDDEVTRSHSHTESSSSSSSETRSSTTGHSTTRGGSRSVVPVTVHDEFREETGRQFWTLEEEWERLVGVVHGLPKRHALIKVYQRPVIHIVTPDIEKERHDERSERFQVRVMESSPYVKPASVVTVEIEDRKKELAALTEKTETGSRPFDVKSFRE